MTLKVLVRSVALLEALAERNYSQNGLARRLGVSSGYMSQVLHGHRSPSPKVRQKLMDALGVTDFGTIFIIIDGAES
jgi:transcriptional regulator with XRE-family HTH domain